jgi:predicted SprT family Zn-dependent metalloprotease
MDAKETQDLMDGLLFLYGLKDWKGKLKKFKTSLGKCYYDQKIIAISSYFAEQMPDETVKDVILHEIAHALTGKGSNHAKAWKQKCIEIGCKPERIYKGERVRVPYKWKITCLKCGEIIFRHRKPWHKSLHRTDAGKIRIELNKE